MLANRTLQAASSGTGYQIQRSIRTRGAYPTAPKYFSRTLTTPTNNLKWTWSAWVKRGQLGIGQHLFNSSSDGSSTYEDYIVILASDRLAFYQTNGSVTAVSTNALLRDPSAWYHIVVVYDSAQGTAANRVAMYINGVAQTFSATTYPSASLASVINSAKLHRISSRSYAADEGFDGYLAEMNFIDGQALTPSSFGQTDPVTGVWSAKRYTGTYGNNGFYLNFSDNTSLSNISQDKSSGSAELITNGLFLSDVSNWTLNTGTGGTPSITFVSGAARIANGSNNSVGYYQTISTVIGQTYYIQGRLFNVSVGAADRAASIVKADVSAFNVNVVTIGSVLQSSGSGTVRGTFVATATTTYIGLFADILTSGSADFDDISVGTLGYMNNWTPTNISLVSDPTYDSMTDVPLGSGGYESTIYPSLNPLDKHAYVTLSNNNLTVTGNTSTDSGPVTATVGAKTGKYYWETTIVAAGGLNYAGIGISNAQNATSAEAYSIATGATAGAGIRSAAGGFNVAYGGYGSYSGATLPGFTTGDIIGVALDLDNGALYFHKNGVWMNTSVPTSGATRSGAFIYWTPGAITARPATGGYNGSIATLNFGQTAFAYTPPTGFGVLKTTANGRGNYATLLPSASSTAAVISAANLSVTTAAASSSNFFKATASISVSSGKWYWESTVGSLTTNNWGLNISGTPPVVDSSTNQNGQLTGEVTYIAIDSSGTPQEVITVNGSVAYTVASTVINGNVVAVAFDADARTVQFYRENIAVGPAQTINTATLYYISAMVRNNTLASIHYVNFGQRPFIYTPPTGFKALHTGNLSIPTIRKPNQYFDVITYTGDSSSSRSITGLHFAPDFVWSKPRTAGSSSIPHWLYDRVRGTGANSLYSLSTNNSDAEFDSLGGSGNATAFTSDGVTFTSGTSNNFNRNESGVLFVNWNWKAGGTAVTNTAGTITSQVSANTTSGFSIVTYTGNGVAGSTIGHGIGVAPALIIVKSRSGASSWFTRHASVGTGYISLDSINALTTSDAPTVYGNGTSVVAPTSSNFTLGAYAGVNGSGITFVAYCFAEVEGYSKFGSYTGNASADGPFVYCGFRPKFILMKRTDSTGNWFLVDTVRATSNVIGPTLFPNLGDAEDTAPQFIDAVSNGFKLRNSASSVNISGATYIFIAFAEAPFKNALAR